VVALTGAAAGVGFASSADAAGGSSPAPVLGRAAQGGPVIVWMTDQHSDLNLRTQATERTALAHADQKPVVADIKANGGTGVVQLVSLNAVAATVSAAEVQRLRLLPGVKEIIADSTVTVGDPETTGPASDQTTTPDLDASRLARKAAEARSGSKATRGLKSLDSGFPTTDCGTQNDPLIEPEALSEIDAPAMTSAGLETEAGHGVIVANDGISTPPGGSLVGNPNFVRPAADGGGSVVIGANAGDLTDSTDSEYYGDASSIDAQGGVEYQYATELPFSGLPDTCYFKIVGDAPGASLVDTHNITTPESQSGDPDTTTDSAIIAGIDAAVMKLHADVINESYGYSNTPGTYAAHYAANDAAITAGVTVVVSSGDSGDSGTVSSPATDPLAIAVGATNTLRESAMAYGFGDWVNNDITPLSSGGTSPNNKVVDLVAPGYSGQAACNPLGSDCPTNTATQSFGGTSESSPLVAGAAADVIAAYRDSHNGDSPSPALVKQLLTGTAKDVDAPADQQGAGLLDIGAAIKAAEQISGSTVQATATSLIPTPTQLDVSGAGGTTVNQSLGVYNPGTTTTVTSSYRSLGAEQPIGSPVTEPVSAPDPSLPIPTDGAQAAQDISFDVPAGLDRLDADMIWPDPTNGTILNYVLIDPEGRLRQLSYDYGAAGTGGRIGSVPNIQHTEVAHPEAGTWTVEVKWGNGRGHLQSLPNVPGAYTGNLSFQASGQSWVTSQAAPPVTIPAHGSVTIPLSIALPADPGDHPESVQLTAANGAATSVPIARRTNIPSAGGAFDTTITSTVGRGVGQISTYDVVVPPGQANLGITVQTPDTDADNRYTLYLINPSGVRNTSPALTNTTVNGAPAQAATVNVANPAAGTWEIDVKLNLTTSGKEFSQTVFGDVVPQAPAITTPVDGSDATTQTPTVTGTGTPGDTVTVVDASSSVLCTSVVADDGTWSCTTGVLAAGPVTLTATQADATASPSPVSGSATITIPASTSVALAIDPAAPVHDQSVDLTATTTGVDDGAVVTFLDGSDVLGTGDVTGGTATLTDPAGLSVGQHSLTASVDATDTSLAAVSPPLALDVAKDASTIALSLSTDSVVYGTPVTGSLAVTGATGGTATVGYGSTTVSVPIDSSGAGTFSLPATLGAGTHTITASYDGTGTVAASGPVSEDLVVTKAPTTTTIHLAKRKVTVGKGDYVRVVVGGHLHGAYPNGTLTVVAKAGHQRTTRTVVEAAGRHGKRLMYVALPQRVGPAQVTVTFASTGSFSGSTSATKQVTIVARHH
jgi:hypothetical protein